MHAVAIHMHAPTKMYYTCILLVHAVMYSSYFVVRDQLLKKNEVSCEVRSFYDVPGAPGLAVKPVSLKSNTRVFLQSISHGSRCLKHKDLVLYKVHSTY